MVATQSSVEVDSSDSMNRTPLMAALITILNNLRYEKMPNDVDDTQWSSIDQGRQNKVAIVEALLHSGTYSLSCNVIHRGLNLPLHQFISLQCLNHWLINN